MLNLPANSPKFCRNLHAPVDIYRANALWLYSCTKYVVVNLRASQYCFIFEWIHNLLCCWKQYVCVVRGPLYLAKEKKILIQIRKIRLVAGSFRQIPEIDWVRCLTRGILYFEARPFQAELILYSRKHVTITSFRIFVVFPNRRVKISHVFRGNSVGKRTKFRGGGGGREEVRPCEVRVVAEELWCVG